MKKSIMKSEYRESFEQQALQHMNDLYRCALHLTRNSADAEDLVQDTYLRAYRHFDQFEPNTDFKRWIFKILKNHFINEYRKSKSRGRTVDFDSIEFDLAAQPAVNAMDARIDATWAGVRAALARLPGEFRLTLLLVCIDGFKYAEVAEIMGCPIGTVMSRLNRARKQMRRSFLEQPPASVSRERRSRWSDEKLAIGNDFSIPTGETTLATVV